MATRRVLVTGGTGLIGHPIALALAKAGERVRCLVRDPERGRTLLPDPIELVKGDITDPSTLAPAMREVQLVFHAAGMPEQWQPDDAIFDRVNHLGTAALLDAALEARVDRVIYTSTMDVFAAERGGTLVETKLDPNPKPTAYERSKQAAERAAERTRERGLDVVYVNPSAVYGPSPVHVGLNDFFIRLLERALPLTPPGGMSVLYVDGCTEGHLKAAERGRPGERYLLSDGYVDNHTLAKLILDADKQGRTPPPRAPEWALRVVAGASAPLARALRFRPLVAPGQLSFLLWQARVDAGKAVQELGFTPTPLERGVEQTVEFLRKEGIPK